MVEFSRLPQMLRLRRSSLIGVNSANPSFRALLTAEQRNRHVYPLEGKVSYIVNRQNNRVIDILVLFDFISCLIDERE